MPEHKPQPPEYIPEGEKSIDNRLQNEEHQYPPEVLSGSESEPHMVEPKSAKDHVRSHVNELMKEHQQSKSRDVSEVDTTDVPKKEASFASWLEDVPEEQRVEVSKTLILTKGKKMMDVIHAFMTISDYQGLDELAEVLSESYDELVAQNILPDLRKK